MKNKTIIRYIIVVMLCLTVTTAYTQSFLKNIKDKASTLVSKAATTDVAGNFLKQPDPIITSFKDVNTTNSLPPEFGNNERYESLDSLDFGPQGYILKPGFFEAELLSYCIMPGTPTSTSGDGYMNAPLKGPLADIVNHIVWNSMFYPKVTQREVQVLLWAIIAKTKFTDFSDAIKLTATTLLTPKDLLKLNGGLSATITDEMFKNEIVKMPAAMQQILNAENEIRKMVRKGENNYEAYEHWAVPAGMVSGEEKVLKGRWTYVADGGYYVRYFPWGYRSNKVQVYLPEIVIQDKQGHGPNESGYSEEQSEASSSFDPTANVSQPVINNAQRLIQSSMTKHLKDALDKSPYFFRWNFRMESRRDFLKAFDNNDPENKRLDEFYEKHKNDVYPMYPMASLGVRG